MSFRLTSRTTRRGFLGSGITGLGVMALSGCSPSTPAPPRAEPGTTAGTSTSAAPSASASSSTAPAAVKQINFYGNSLGEDAQKAAWQTVIDGYTENYGVEVKPVIYPYDQAATQLALMGRSGELAGVVQAGPWQVLQPMGVLADLSDIATGLGIPQSVLDGFTVDGQILVLPLTAAGIGLIANGEIAKSVGLTSGMTVEAFAGALEKIKQQDADIIPYAAVTKNPDLKDAAHWMWTFGSPVVTDDRECTIGDAESVAAITWYKELQDAGLTKAGVARGDARILFATGRTALYDDAPLASQFVVTNGASEGIIANISAIARPTAGGASYNRYWGNGLCATQGATEAANKEFIMHAASDIAAATALYEQSSVAPAAKTVADQIPALAQDRFQNEFRTHVSENAHIAGWDKVAVTAQIDTAIGQGVASILAGQDEVQDGLNKLKQEVQDLLDSNA